MRLRLAAAALAATATPGQAEWLKASSRHFVIYSDSNAAAIDKLATRLEQVDGSLRAISGMADTPESAANPVTVFVLDSIGAVQKLAGGRGIAGFYLPRADGSVAFTPRTGGDLSSVDAQIVLFHEYAHHFLLSGSSAALPAWLSEGYAEFVSTARFTDAGVMIGAGAQHRARGLFAADELPLATLFAPGPRMTGEQQEQLYGRGWLLTHYLLFDVGRRKSLVPYLSAINAGTPPLKAATDAFGDLQALDRALDKYLRARTLAVSTITNDRLPKVAVDIRPLTPGERALIDMRIVSTHGVDAKTAAPLYARAARAAAPHPADATAQGWLAEMAFDAGKDDEAEAAADRALAADPKSVQALTYKGRVRLRRIAGRGADPKTWSEARSWIVKANRVDPNRAAALMHYYDSFVMAGVPPTRTAIAGLHRALELAPQDPGLRFRSARQHLVDGEIAGAKRALRPLAFSAHAAPANPAARLLAMIDGGAAGPAALAALQAEDEAKAPRVP